ncbi:hypothetical protein M440DRAFT_153273 [Trichoderma longibrachiatum ATCC 18648]|uniref:Uncharacterized protein n=1 Tax=Trichoderma longibrachiatum ATCC 18648 TaxID=983965 RepID=A0A2T4BU40_TRILO|nr:hypothetical protein M440DRAFT_153273 [Trichoderma longibrachiatum ATCC 18648]
MEVNRGRRRAVDATELLRGRIREVQVSPQKWSGGMDSGEEEPTPRFRTVKATALAFLLLQLLFPPTQASHPRTRLLLAPRFPDLFAPHRCIISGSDAREVVVSEEKEGRRIAASLGKQLPLI